MEWLGSLASERGEDVYSHWDCLVIGKFEVEEN